MGEFESLDQDTSATTRAERHAYDRLIMLSDGVFAIAMTLAALEIRPPEHWNGDPAALLRLMQPTLTAYLIAFIVISAYWIGHRNLIAMLRRVDGPANLLNLVVLGLVALQPAAIRFLADYGAHRGAYGIYFVQIGVLCLAQAGLWVYAWLAGDLVFDTILRPARFFVLANTLATPFIGAAIGIMISRSNGIVATLLAALLVVIRIARHRGAKRLGLYP